MVRRKGMGLGRGRGYKNLIGKDKSVHSDSAKGRKQPKEPKFIPYKSNRLTAKDREKLSKQIVKNIMTDYYVQDLSDINDEEGSEIVADTLDDFERYYTGWGMPNEYYIVKNIKSRGFPYWDDVKDEVAKQMGVSREYVDEHLTDEFLDQLFWSDVEFVVDDYKEFGYEWFGLDKNDDFEFSVVGRSGGYWGLKYSTDMLEFDEGWVKKEVDEFLKSDGNRIAKEARERRGDYGKAMTKKEFEQAFAHDFEDEIALSEDTVKLSKKYEKAFKELNKDIEGTIKDFESKDRWVENIMANEYVPKEKTPFEMAQEAPDQTRLKQFAKTKKKERREARKKRKGKFNELNMIMAYEGGELDDVDTLELFKNLVKNGHAWSLQGHYGRTASALIDDGFITKDGKYTDKGKDFIEVNG